MSTRSCGFCRRVGHTVKTCIDSKAIDLVHSAESKCNIALQYVETPESSRLFHCIQDWFSERSVPELRLLISKKGWDVNGNKKLLIAKVIFTYYFNNPIRFASETNRNEFLAIRKYWYNIADEMPHNLAMFHYNADMELCKEPEPEQEKIKITDGVEIEAVECPICLETEEKIAITNCGHNFCKGCIDKHTEGFVKPCPCCRTTICFIKVNY